MFPRSNEYEVLSSLAKSVNLNPTTKVGIGDDAAVLHWGNKTLVLATDTLVENQHFRFDWFTLTELCDRALMQNFADIYAVGGKPVSFLLTLGCPGHLAPDKLTACLANFAKRAQKWQVDLIGGDLVGSQDFFISLTVIGELKAATPLLLNNSKPGDIVAVSGQIGASAAGLALLTAGENNPSELINLYKVPRISLTSFQQAIAAGITVMTDISDGLLRELDLIAKKSKVKIIIDPKLIPAHPDLFVAATKLGKHYLEWQLYGGEDHTFIATFPPNKINQLSSWKVIGEVKFGQSQVEYNDGTIPEILGWDIIKKMG